MSYQKKDGYAGPHPPFFWYDTDFLDFLNWHETDFLDFFKDFHFFFFFEKSVSYQKNVDSGNWIEDEPQWPLSCPTLGNCSDIEPRDGITISMVTPQTFAEFECEATGATWTATCKDGRWMEEDSTYLCPSEGT